MSESKDAVCPECGLDQPRFCRMRGIDCVSTGDVDCQGRTLKLVKAKLRASEAECRRVQAQLENVLDSSKEGAWMARALDAERENQALMAALKPQTVKELEAEVARLTRELEDVRKLDASGHGWHMRDSSPGCEEVCYVPAVRSDGWHAPPGQHAAARRAAVEYLEKEKKDE